MTDKAEEAKNLNMSIWDQVCTTNIKETKEAKLDGRKVTSISTQSVVMAATKMFGPVGKGWGYEIVEERYDDAEPMLNSKTGDAIGFYKIHTIRLRLWYLSDGEKYYVEQFGHTKYTYNTSSNKFFVDSEAPKKSLSDAMKKCFSLLGFNADVYLGKFEDVGYVAELEIDQEIKAAADSGDKKMELMEEANKMVKDACELLKSATNKVILDTMYNTKINQIKPHYRGLGEDPSKAIARIDKSYWGVMNEIDPLIKDVTCTACSSVEDRRKSAHCSKCNSK